MPYRKKGKCVYKTTGKKMGCTKGDVDKYLTALRINAKEDANADKFKKFDNVYNEFTTMYGKQKITDDTTVTAEAEYAPGQDAVGQHGGYDTIGFKNNAPTFTVEKDQKNKVIDAAIEYLEQLKKFGIPTEGEKKEGVFNRLKKIADSLFKVGIEPTDIIASIRDPRRANQYLITGPSAPGGGGKGALLDLKDIKGGLLMDDESNPGGADTSADIEQIDLNTTPAQNDPNSFNDRPEGALEENKKKSKLEQVIDEINRREFLNAIDENFIDKKGPGRPGDSKRHGIKKKASLASLDKIVHSKTASPRKKQLAHWQANMRRGKAKLSEAGYLLEAKRKKAKTKKADIKYFREITPYTSQHSHLKPTSVLKRYYTTNNTIPFTIENLQTVTPVELSTLLKDKSQSTPPYYGPYLTIEEAKELVYKVGKQAFEQIDKHPYKTFNDGFLALIYWVMVPIIKNIVFDEKGKLLVRDTRFKTQEYFMFFVANDILNVLCSRNFIGELKPKNIKQKFD